MAINNEERRENASVLIVIGLGLLVVALLVVFFAPAAFKTGHQTVFTAIIVALVVIGFGLVLRGRKLRKSAI